MRNNFLPISMPLIAPRGQSSSLPRVRRSSAITRRHILSPRRNRNANYSANERAVFEERARSFMSSVKSAEQDRRKPDPSQPIDYHWTRDTAFTARQVRERGSRSEARKVSARLPPSSLTPSRWKLCHQPILRSLLVPTLLRPPLPCRLWDDARRRRESVFRRAPRTIIVRSRADGNAPPPRIISSLAMTARARVHARARGNCAPACLPVYLRSSGARVALRTRSRDTGDRDRGLDRGRTKERREIHTVLPPVITEPRIKPNARTNPPLLLFGQ